MNLGSAVRWPADPHRGERGDADQGAVCLTPSRTSRQEPGRRGYCVPYAEGSYPHLDIVPQDNLLGGLLGALRFTFAATGGESLCAAQSPMLLRVRTAPSTSPPRAVGWGVLTEGTKKVPRSEPQPDHFCTCGIKSQGLRSCCRTEPPMANAAVTGPHGQAWPRCFGGESLPDQVVG